jgi:hypothetical protein
LKDQSTTQSKTDTSQASSEETKDVDTSSDNKPKPRAPESYSFKTDPANGDLDKEQLARATPLFKELDLDQAQAQKLVDFFTGFQKQQLDAVKAMREGWVAKINADPEMGGKLEQIKADIGRAYTHLPADVVKDFKAAMDLTGAGDHPAFVKAFWKFSQLIGEGTHVSGGGPTKEGQKSPNSTSRPTLASAMYPNLSSQ